MIGLEVLNSLTRFPMKKKYIGLCLTLLVCNFAFSMESHNNQRKMNKEVIAQLIDRNEAHLAHKEKLTANADARERWSKPIVILGIFISLGGAYFMPKPTDEEKRTIEEYENKISEFQQNYSKKFSIVIAGALISLAGALIGASVPDDDRQVDMDYAKANIEQLKAVLTALQTKSPSPPEAPAEGE